VRLQIGATSSDIARFIINLRTLFGARIYGVPGRRILSGKTAAMPGKTRKTAVNLWKRSRRNTLGMVLGGAVLVFTAAGIAWSLWTVRTATIRILPGQTHQTIDGWQVTPKWWEMNKTEDRFDGSWKPFRDQILDRMANELGINSVRLEVRSGLENPVDYWKKFETGEIGYLGFRKNRYEKINDNDDPNTAAPEGFQFSHLDWQVEEVLLPLQRFVEANGEKVYINLCYVDFEGSLEGNLQHALNPDEYAELMNEAFLHLKTKYHLVPDSLEIILEPDNSEHWRGSRIGAALVKAAQRLHANGFFPEFIAPSTARARNASAYFDEVVAIPGAAELLSTLSYHRYDGPLSTFLGRGLGAIQRRASRFGLKTAMLEHLTGNAEELHTDLKEMNVSSWQVWGIAHKSVEPNGFNANEYYEVDTRDPEKPRIWMTRPTRGLAHYFRFVRRGAVRVGATTNSPSKNPVAFRNPDGTYVVVVKATHEGDIAILGLPAGRYVIRYTEESTDTPASQDSRPPQTVMLDSGKALGARIPAKGIWSVHSATAANSNSR
jgi:O-glycosyl hydrolase